ncbi:nuclear transport factor 2 family protein, partial [Actinomadura sp. 7K507]
ERWAVREWTRSDAGRLRPKEAAGPSGTRDGDDPLVRLQRKLRGTEASA